MNFLTFLSVVISLFIILIGTLCIFIGGFQYATSGGDVGSIMRSKSLILRGLGIIVGGIILAVLVIIGTSLISNKQPLTVSFSPLFLGEATSVLTILAGILSIFTGGFQYVTSGGDVGSIMRSKSLILRGLGIIVGGIILAVLVIIGISLISNKQSLFFALFPFFLPTVTVITLIPTTITLVYLRRRARRIRTRNYSAKIGELTKSLTKASTQVDRILQEMALAVKDQEAVVSALKQEQARLQTEIDILKKSPEADKLFTEYMAQLDKKNTKIQWILFGVGTVIGLASLIIGIISLHH